MTDLLTRKDTLRVNVDICDDNQIQGGVQLFTKQILNGEVLHFIYINIKYKQGFFEARKQNCVIIFMNEMVETPHL